MYVQLEDGVIRDISFEGSGCAISKASASLMTTSVMGKTLAQARALFAGFHDLITDGHWSGCNPLSSASSRSSPASGSSPLE